MKTKTTCKIVSFFFITYKRNALGMLARNGGYWFAGSQYFLVMFNQFLQQRSVLRSGILFGRQVLDLRLDVAQILRERIIDKSLEINTPRALSNSHQKKDKTKLFTTSYLLTC